MPPTFPIRKRTFAVTTGDAGNGYASGRIRRQRTSSTTSVETIRGPIPFDRAKLSPSRVLKPADANEGQEAASTASKSVDIAKPPRPHRSGIPRPVALKVNITNTENQKTLVTSTKTLVTLSTATKPSPAAPPVVKTLRARRRNGDPVNDSPKDLLLSTASPLGTPPRTASSKARSTRSRKSLEDAPSENEAAIVFPTSAPPKSKGKMNPRPERPSSNPPGPIREKPQPEKVVEERVRSQAYTDSYGCVHLAASDCQLFISFLKSPHHEVWDVPDDVLISCPAFLYIMAKDLSAWDGTPLSIPDVTLIDIRCRTKFNPSRFSNRQSDVDSWEGKFEGHEVPTTSGDSGPTTQLHPGTISIEMKWDRVYSMPAPTGLSSTLIANPPSTEQSGTTFSDNPRPQVPGRGWRLKFWIPIPAYLFMRKETRTFQIDAEVFIAPGDDKRAVDLTQITQSVYTRTEMTVSHLRMEREVEAIF